MKPIVSALLLGVLAPLAWAADSAGPAAVPVLPPEPSPAEAATDNGSGDLQIEYILPSDPDDPLAWMYPLLPSSQPDSAQAVASYDRPAFVPVPVYIPTWPQTFSFGNVSIVTSPSPAFFVPFVPQGASIGRDPTFNPLTANSLSIRQEPQVLRSGPNVARMPLNVARGPLNVMQGPVNVMRQPGNVMRGPINVMRRPSNVARQPANTRR